MAWIKSVFSTGAILRKHRNRFADNIFERLLLNTRNLIINFGKLVSFGRLVVD